MIDIVNRLRFDAIRCAANFSRGVASNIDAGADEIERLRTALPQKIAEMSSNVDDDPAIPAGDKQWKKGYKQACSDIIAMIYESRPESNGEGNTQ